MKGWRLRLAWSGLILVVALAWFFARSSGNDTDTDTAGAIPLDPGYAARDAEVIETGYDGRERYRLKAAVIRQQTESGVIDLEQLEMNYHRNTQALPGETPVTAKNPGVFQFSRIALSSRHRTQLPRALLARPENCQARELL